MLETSGRSRLMMVKLLPAQRDQLEAQAKSEGRRQPHYWAWSKASTTSCIIIFLLTTTLYHFIYIEQPKPLHSPRNPTRNIAMMQASKMLRMQPFMKQPLTMETLSLVRARAPMPRLQQARTLRIQATKPMMNPVPVSPSLHP